eukprot:scaffold24079_cov21-Tisochrysis_lutea.AAC.1
MGEGVADRPSRSAKAMHIPYTALFADYMDEDAAESSQEEEKEGGHTGPDVRTGVEEEEGDPPSFCTGVCVCLCVWVGGCVWVWVRARAGGQEIED